MNIFKNYFRPAVFAATLLSTLVISGCSFSPRQAKITLAPLPTATAEASDKPTIFISGAKDDRVFSLNAVPPEDQSLETVEQLDPATTATAVAQVRGTNKKVIYDVFLEDRTVADVVSESLEESFRRAGFKVVSKPTETPDPNAIPVEIDIKRFWGYNTGFWTFEFFFDIEITLTAQVAELGSGKSFKDTTNLSSWVAASPNSYRNTISRGMEQFVEKIAQELR